MKSILQKIESAFPCPFCHEKPTKEDMDAFIATTSPCPYCNKHGEDNVWCHNDCDECGGVRRVSLTEKERARDKLILRAVRTIASPDMILGLIFMVAMLVLHSVGVV